MEHFIIGMDIGGTNIRIGAVNEENKVVYFSKVYQKSVFINESYLECLIHFIDNFICENKLEGKISGIAIAMPATINKEGTIVLQAPCLPEFDNLNLVEPLESYFHVKTSLLKDVWTAAIYDVEKYRVPSENVIAAFYVGTGIGNVIIIDGKIYKGKNGVSGELGHIPVKDMKLECDCGNNGCIEMYAGGKYLARICDANGYSIENVFSEADKTDIDDYIDTLAIAVATEINILDPDYILIGGGVLQMNSFPKEMLEKAIRQYTRKPYPEENMEIYFVDDDSEKGVVGAVMYARNLEV